MASYQVAVLVGSLRKASITRKIAQALIGLAPAGLRCKLVEIGDLAMYNEDLETDVPAPWTRFRNEIAAAQAVIFLTPEYNRSMPGCIKNAIDVASKPQGKNAWDGKPAAIVSVTPYKLGGFGANHALRQALVYINVPAMQQPEAYISDAAELVDDYGSFKKEETRKFFKDFLAAYERWVAALAKQP